MVSKVESRYCLIGEDAVLTWYGDLLDAGVITPDEKQAEAVRLLQEMADQMAAPSIDDKKGFFHSLKSRLRPADNTASGLYFHGGVGRGKSF